MKILANEYPSSYCFLAITDNEKRFYNPTLLDIDI
jgi:hypothetical protein